MAGISARAAPSLALYFLSGAAGLAWEVCWSRLLTRHLGGLVPALTALLAAYLGGLALGGAIGGRWAARPGRPLRRFAALEIATAALAWPVGPALEALEPWFRRLYALHLSAGAARVDAGGFAVPAAAAAAALVLPAAVAMGATLPVLGAGARRAAAEAGGSIGRLYASNTLGAVCGALATGLVLLPRLGLAGSLGLAAATNAAAAAAALALDLRRRETIADCPDSERPPARRPGPLLAAVGLSSAASMVAQIGWTRALALSIGSSTYAFTLTLAAFLSGLGAGGAAGSRLARRTTRPAAALAGAQAAAGVACVASLAILGRLPAWIVPPLARAGASHGAVLAVQGIAAALVVGLPTLLLGAAFPLAVRLRAGSGAGPGRSAGDVYAISSAGMVAGAVSAGALLLPRLGLRGSLLAAALALPAAAALTAGAAPARERRPAAGLAAAGALAALAATPWSGWDPALVTSGPFLHAPLQREAPPGDAGAAPGARGDLVELREGAAATVTVRRARDGTLSLQINGKTDASTGGDMVTQLLAGHLPALLAPEEPSSALVIGLASGVSLGALERYPLRAIDCVELLPEVVAVADRFAAASGQALSDPRVRLIVGDGRAHLRYAPARYDVITSQPTNPWVAGTAALYTREAFAAARDALAEGGVFCQWIQGYSLLPDDLRSVVATFLDVFPSATLWEESPGGGDYFLVGRTGAGPAVDLSRLDERLRRPAVAADLARAGIGEPADLLAHFVAGPASLARYAAGATLQVDDRLSLEFTAPRALHRDTLPDQVRGLRRFRESPAAQIGGSASPDLMARLRALRAAARREERLVLSLRRGPMPAATPELQLGLELLLAGLPGPAERHLRAALVEQPDLPEAQALLGAVLASSGRGEEARQELRAAVRAAPDDIASRALLARLDLEAGDGEAAALGVREALRREPEDADLHNLAGAAALLQDRPDEAASALGRALELDPELAEAWSNLGVAARRRGDPAGAERAYRRALALDPTAPDARFNLAVLRRLSGEPAEAASLLADLLRDDPADLEARWERAQALRQLGRLDEAIGELREVVARGEGTVSGALAAAALENR